MTQRRQQLFRRNAWARTDRGVSKFQKLFVAEELVRPLSEESEAGNTKARVTDWLRLALPVLIVAAFMVLAWRFGYFSLKTPAQLDAAADRVEGLPVRLAYQLAAIGLGRAAQSLLYQLNGYDPVVIAGAAVALATVAFLAGFLPALKASRIDPMEALRYE